MQLIGGRADLHLTENDVYTRQRSSIIQFYVMLNYNQLIYFLQQHIQLS